MEPQSATTTNPPPQQPHPLQVSPILHPKSPTSFLEPPLSAHSAVPSMPLPPSRYPIAADTYHGPHAFQASGGHSHPSPPYNGPRPADPTSSGPGLLHTQMTSPKTEESPYSPVDPYGNYPPLYNGWSYKQQQPQVVPLPPPQQVPPLSYYYRPRRLEEIAPRDTISLIIALFFDFVYPLTPCIHKPSFMADLHARREERDPLFFALVMSTVASTLVQVPRSYLPMERPVVRKLAQVRKTL